ncbi:hypothetical protein GGR53DRAFT_233518 [Hypoxylon sp. FL1150]|nr:hypothetical protein GGR53DRAFT_233518 [Hypoxylon sp. FL1150]
MGCECVRISFHYACCHKKREFHPCWRRTFMKQNPCITVCLPRCQYERIVRKINRVCDGCLGYFVTQFGEEAARVISDEFISYKTFIGCRKQLILPESIPHESYLTEGFLTQAGAKITKHKEPFRNPHMSLSPIPANIEEWWERKRERQARAESNAESRQQRRSEPTNLFSPYRLPPLTYHPARPERPERPERRRNQSSSSAKPSHRAKKPSSSKTHKAAREAKKSKPSKNNGNNGIGTDDIPLVTIPAMVHPHLHTHRWSTLQGITESPEDVDERILHGIPPRGTPEQPKALTAKQAARERNPRPTGSDCSLVKRFNEVAELTEAELREREEKTTRQSEAAEVSPRTTDENSRCGTKTTTVSRDSHPPRIPKLSPAPKVPSWRADTPRPELGTILIGNVPEPEDRHVGRGKSKARDKDKGRAPSVAVRPVPSTGPSPSPILTSPSVAAPLRSAPLYVVCDGVSPLSGSALARASIRTPKSGASSSLMPPRRRTPGVSPMFQEKGLPTPSYLQQSFVMHRRAPPSGSNGGAGDRQSPPPMLVAIREPESEYSCASQAACWCEADDADADVCPACRERRRLERDLNMEWI